MKSINILKAVLCVAVSIALTTLVLSAAAMPVAYAPVIAILAAVIMSRFNATGHAYNIITGTPFTFNGKEATEGVIEPAFKIPELSEFITIVENIKAKEQIAFLGRLSKITKADDGCGTGATQKSVTTSEKFWNPEKVKFWLTQCEDEIENSFFVWGTKNGINRYDLTTGDFIEFVMEIMTDAVMTDAMRFIWFGDKTATTIALGGNIQDAANLDYYTPVDGLWKQIFAAVTATTMKQVSVTENAGANYAAQALASDAALTYARSLYEQADPRLKADKTKIYIFSQSMWENWLTSKESKTLDSSFARQDKDFNNRDTYRGVPILVCDFWDRVINEDMNDGTAWKSPHRMLLTTKDNLLAGFDSSDEVKAIDVFFNKETEINHMKGGYKIDTKIYHDFMTIAAY